MVLTCIRCPMGCPLQVETENGQVSSVTGNACARGADYARTEAVAPKRVVTGTIRVRGGIRPVVSVKTVPEVPKSAAFPVMEEIRSYRGIAPIKIGEILMENIAGTGSSLVATAHLPAK